MLSSVTNPFLNSYKISYGCRPYVLSRTCMLYVGEAWYSVSFVINWNDFDKNYKLNLRKKLTKKSKIFIIPKKVNLSSITPNLLQEVEWICHQYWNQM